MEPGIDSTSFGSITIAGQRYEYDVFIRLNGEIKKRVKKLSKAVTGTSHIVSLDEARHIYQTGSDSLIVGTGQSGRLKLSDEAAEFFREANCRVRMYPTPDAIRLWNESQGNIIGLFHLTC